MQPGESALIKKRALLRLLVLVLVVVAIVASFVMQFALAFAGLGSVVPFVGWLAALVASVALGRWPVLMTGLLAVVAGAELVFLAIGLMLQAPPSGVSDCATVEQTGVWGVSDSYWAVGISVVGVVASGVMLAGTAIVRRLRGVLVLGLGGVGLTVATYVFLTGGGHEDRGV